MISKIGSSAGGFVFRDEHYRFCVGNQDARGCWLASTEMNYKMRRAKREFGNLRLQMSRVKHTIQADFDSLTHDLEMLCLKMREHRLEIAAMDL